MQDRVFLGRAGQYTDPHYAKARERLFLIAVECEESGGTCFCTSMGTGPEVNTERMALPVIDGATVSIAAVDLILTELDAAFVVRAGSVAGQHMIAKLQVESAPAEDVANAQQRVAKAATQQKPLDVSDIHDLLHRNQEHPRWDNVADRCLACTNCTLVCPTCFCSSVEDVTDLTLENAERCAQWDSCFNPEFAQVHGGNFRPSIRGRYRQWLTHKFASWFDQFVSRVVSAAGAVLPGAPSASMSPRKSPPSAKRTANGRERFMTASSIRRRSRNMLLQPLGERH